MTSLSRLPHIDVDGYSPQEAPVSTPSLVGSIERIRVYRDRIEKGFALFHPSDMTRSVPPSYSSHVWEEPEYTTQEQTNMENDDSDDIAPKSPEQEVIDLLLDTFLDGLKTELKESEAKGTVTTHVPQSPSP